MYCKEIKCMENLDFITQNVCHSTLYFKKYLESLPFFKYSKIYSSAKIKSVRFLCLELMIVINHARAWKILMEYKTVSV